MKISYIYLRIYKVLQIKKYIKETIFKKKREKERKLRTQLTGLEYRIELK